MIRFYGCFCFVPNFFLDRIVDDTASIRYVVYSLYKVYKVPNFIIFAFDSFVMDYIFVSEKGVAGYGQNSLEGCFCFKSL